MAPPPRPPLTLDRALRHSPVVNLFLKYPGREFTIREAAGEARAPYATTWRVVRDLVALGVLTSKRAGHSQIIRLNPGSYILEDLRRLRSLELSPHRGAARRFAERAGKLRGVARVLLFGSVARGLERTTSDVDVAVVVDRRGPGIAERVREIAADVQEESRVAVVPILLSLREAASDGQLARDVRAGEVLYERP